MNVNNLIYEDKLSDDEFKILTEDERLLWITRPKRDGILAAKKGMIFRASLLGFALISYITESGIYLDHEVLIGFLFCYEIAYYTLRKEDEERKYGYRLTHWMEQLDQIKSQNS
jgi:hypothetical protein